MTRKATPVFWLLVLGGLPFANAAVEFERSGLDAALDKARRERKLVLIDFYADWCGPCKILDSTTWQDEEVSALSRYFVNLKVDTEDGAGVELSRRFGVQALPTIAFLDAEGKALGRELGYQPPARMLSAMRRALGRGDGQALLDLAEAAPQDGRLQLEASRRMAELKRWEQAERLLERAATAAENQDSGFQRQLLLTEADLAKRQAKWPEAAEAYRRVVERFDDAPEAVSVRGELAGALARAGRGEEALAAYREAVRLRPDSVATLNGFAWFCATERLGLDEALSAARRAVELSARAAGVLDTLAEVHYARGEYAEAIEVITEAIRIEPRDPYYQKQHEKFLTAQRALNGTAAPGKGSRSP
jgi:tetratricopeptide (TPR) repeat protein